MLTDDVDHEGTDPADTQERREEEAMLLRIDFLEQKIECYQADQERIQQSLRDVRRLQAIVANTKEAAIRAKKQLEEAKELHFKLQESIHRFRVAGVAGTCDLSGASHGGQKGDEEPGTDQGQGIRSAEDRED